MSPSNALGRAIGGLAAIYLGMVAQSAEAQAPIPGTTIPCAPIKERVGRQLGCFVVDRQPLGQLAPQPVWHIYTFPTLAEGTTVKPTNGTVFESFGKVWLFAIAAADWKPAGGQQVAKIGPFPIDTSAKYTALYFETIFDPGMTAFTHRHSGPEAWLTLSGETCVETPEGKLVGKPGQTLFLAGGVPMALKAVGTAQRHSLTLILYDSTQAATTAAPDWHPKGLCDK